MTIKNPVLFGLKVANIFSDIESKNTALNNLGLDIRDLEVISGISESLSRSELQQVSGLDVNLTRFIDRLKSDTSQYSNLINLSSGFAVPTRGNLEAFGAISGGAIRYQYVPNDKGIDVTSDDLKYGDISTSRVSAWSGGSEINPTEPVSYGASVQVRGSLKLGQSATYSNNVPINESILNVIDDPEPVRFDTEVPTEILKINVNGQPGYVYAMRGIPQIFTTAFKKLTMQFGYNDYVVDGIPLTPIFTFTDTDNGNEIVSRPIPNNRISVIRFNSSQFKEREMRVYFPPKFITSINATNCSLATFPKVKYESIKTITLTNNILTELPNFSEIAYKPIYNATKTAVTGYDSELTSLGLQNNKFYVDFDEDQRFLGSHSMTRLPSNLRTLNIRGCYNQHTTFLDANDFVALSVSQTEYLAVLLDSEEKQTFTFNIGNPAQSIDVKGIYFDKYTYTPTGGGNVYYVYIKEPTRVGTTDTFETIPGYEEQVDVLDFYTKTPRLRSLNLQDLGARRIYRTSNSKYVDVYNEDYYGYINNVEITPRLNLLFLEYFNVYNCYFTKLSPAFENPETDGGLGAENSPLEYFNVGENEALTSNDIKFLKMTAIKTISIYDTALPIPSGLSNKTQLSELNCNYTRFPSRSPGTSNLAPGGQPEPQNNHLWGTTTPTALSDYNLQGCSNLRSLRFYSSRLDGMIPKFTGNDELRSIDFRYTNIEGGRPGGVGAVFNNGDHGRRYIMWDDTFQDAQKITSIRIFSNKLGRNIGTYSPGAGPSYVGEDGTNKISDYVGAEFQDGVFSLPLLNYLLIDTNGNFLNGAFFSTSGAPSLRELHSNGVGWGKAFDDGTPFPSFNGNINLYRVDLRNNKFKGTITLVNLNKLRFFYASGNIIDNIGNLSNLGALNYFYVGNNSLTGAVPDFSASAPNLQFAGLENNSLNVYPIGSLRTMTRLRSLDLSNNNLNDAAIDKILEDLLINYNTAKRGGVVINLTSIDNSMGAPTRGEIITPTTITTKVGEETIVVNQLDPLNPDLVFNLQTLNIRNDTVGSAPFDTINFAKLYLDGVEIILPNAIVQLDYANDQVEFQPGFAPSQGTVIKVEAWRTINGQDITETGGILIKRELNSKGWTVQTN